MTNASSLLKIVSGTDWVVASGGGAIRHRASKTACFCQKPGLNGSGVRNSRNSFLETNASFAILQESCYNILIHRWRHHIVEKT